MTIGARWTVTIDPRIGSLNLHAYPNPEREQIHRLAEIIKSQDCDVVLLQECLRPWLAVVCEAVGLRGIHSHRLAPEARPRSFSPDACAIAWRSSLELGEHWRIPPERFMPDALQGDLSEDLPGDFRPMLERLAYRYSGRSILAELTMGDAGFVVGSFHATPGTGTVHGMDVDHWKPFFHALDGLRQRLVDTKHEWPVQPREFYGDRPGRRNGRGVRKLQALLGPLAPWPTPVWGQPEAPRARTGRFRARPTRASP